jgi:hypothetical protein
MNLGGILKSVGGTVALAGVSFAANMTAAELISAGSPICGILGLLPYGGALLFVTGGSIAGYHYMKGDMEARQMAKFKLEGIMLGAGLLLLLPMLAQYVFGFGVCTA